METSYGSGDSYVAYAEGNIQMNTYYEYDLSSWYPYAYGYYYDETFNSYDNLQTTQSYHGIDSNVVNIGIQSNHTQLMKTISTLSTALYSIAFFVGVIGNGLVIWIAGCKMKNISSVWFLNLAIVDFTCCASLPIRILESNLDSTIHFSHDLCKIGSSILGVTMGTSVSFLTAMSIDRFVSTMWPFWSKVHRTRRTARIASFFIWILSLFLTCPFVLLNNFYEDVSDCSFKDGAGNKTYRFNMYISKFLFSFVAPFLIILFCYGGVLLKVKNLKRNKKTYRPHKIITAVITSFFITGFPYHTWRLIPELPQKNIDIILYNAFNCLAYFNSVINPILYVIVGKSFKISFKPQTTEISKI